MIRHMVLWSGFLLLALSLPAQAHNGAVALAMPVEGITIDGDLSDWPQGMRRYPILAVTYGDRLKNTADLKASVRFGYNPREQALYLGIEVEDDSVVEKAQGALDYNTQDGCEVWLNAAHQSADQDSGDLGRRLEALAQWVLWGNSRSQYYAAKAEDAKVEMRWGEKGYCYEWRIALGERGQQVPNRSVGIYLVVADKDGDGSFTWVVWGEGFPYSPEGWGDVVLVAKEGVGKLQGRVRWEDEEEGRSLGRVGIRSQAAESLRVSLKTDSAGGYEVEMPPGVYRVEAGYRRQQTAAAEVEVKEGETAPVAEMSLARPPLGKSVPAGPGIRVLAGPGTRQGVWYNLDVPDGLSSMTVTGMLEDRKGDLWFATAQGQGLSHYDGRYFITFTAKDGLGGHFLTTVFEDRAGSIWIGTDGGVSRYDGHEFTNFSTEDGLAANWVPSIFEDKEGQLWFATSSGVSRFDGKRFKTFTTQDGLVSNDVDSILEDREGQLWFGTSGGGVSRYDGKVFKTFTTQDGLANNQVQSILGDREGRLWFGTGGGGVSRYDGKSFKTFTIQDGLADSVVTTILEDREGQLWFGTNGGVSCYDGQQFTTFAKTDGLSTNDIMSSMEDREGGVWFGSWTGGVNRYAGNQFHSFKTDESSQNWVNCITEDRRGNLWFGATGVRLYDGHQLKAFNKQWQTVGAVLEDSKGNLWFGLGSRYSPGYRGGGVVRYDGKEFRTFTVEDGLVLNNVTSILEDREGRLWFGTVQGVSRYDGKEFKTFNTRDGLADNYVSSMVEDRKGQLWFGTVQGVSRYDGKEFKTFTTKDGLADNQVQSVLEDREGRMWFGTRGGGVSRYDGKEWRSGPAALADLRFKTFTTQEGLADNVVYSMMEDREGQLWFGTGGGVSRYDGLVFQNLSRADGLINNQITEILQDRQGNIYLGTADGVTRYRPQRLVPPVMLGDVVADQRYGPVEQLSLPSSQQYLAFEFRCKSYGTRQGQMAYAYQLTGYDKEWRWTREEKVEYTDLPSGEYVFQVKAVDRDLNYSADPATVQVRVHPPYGQLALGGGLALSLIGLVFALGTAVRRRRAFLHEQQARLRAQEALNQELEDELQTAHTLQMDLMPRESPRIAGLDLAGRCIPANHVGGDLFQYFHHGGKLSIALADVTGHAMEAAIPMVMFSGILENQMEQGGTPHDLFARLNRSLHRTLKNRSLVCCVLAELNLSTRALRLASAAFPYPYHFCAATGEITELQVDAYPLGVRPDTRYAVVERQLEPGDCLAFCSDGIIETANAAGDQFGYERTAEVIRRGCQEDLSAEGLLARIIEEAKAFSGEVPQGDDQTVVVLKVAT
ncbi:MAG: SpoIIE family protein phosphatase [Candidatus Latescibacteria bacterium]|nr:SpoIIE family protein phosphatase [Candidatus Latescibacterota bacterium]